KPPSRSPCRPETESRVAFVARPMPRIACLLVPDLPVAALCRVDPELAGQPLVLTASDGAHARVVAASGGARARGVRPGMHSAAHARAAAADLASRQRGAAASAAAARALPHL